MGTLWTHVGRFICLLTIFCTISASPLLAVTSASIVICAETGKVHHEKNADEITHPASLTKMMTLYLTFKALREGKLTFNQSLPVSKHATQATPSKLWLKAGSTITVRQAILALVTKSANDASIVLAEALGKGSETHFATLMTQQANQLGMIRTVFKNAHGLPNKQQVTTARDMATLSRSLYKHFPEYFKFFKEPKFVYKGQVHANHNHLLGKIPGVDGIKTGFINASGFNLAASMVRDNRRVIAVVMGGESVKARDTKMVKLLETTYADFGGQKCQLPGKEKTIEDLIFALNDSKPQVTPMPKNTEKVQKAAYKSSSKPAKFLKAKYISVGHLLNDLDEGKTSPKKSVPKAFPKKAKKDLQEKQRKTAKSKDKMGKKKHKNLSKGSKGKH